ncbi:MAG: (2Fe-2S)-binding protein [Planctomycetes bacterium]|nr:(2Fe-2S)-binding protein [Planctomycetota bacterium]
MEPRTITLTVNGDRRCVAVRPNLTLVEALRDELHLTGTKQGCGTGDCGACTVYLDGRPVNSCLTLAVEADGRSVTTVEGLAPSGTELHPVQEAFIAHGAVQCGYCTPGMVMSSAALLSREPAADEPSVRHALAGNLCRCTGYTKIVEAVLACVGDGSCGAHGAAAAEGKA